MEWKQLMAVSGVLAFLGAIVAAANATVADPI